MGGTPSCRDVEAKVGIKFYIPERDKFWRSATDDLNELRETCRAQSEWPTSCNSFGEELEARVAVPEFDIGVVCGIVSHSTASRELPATKPVNRKQGRP